MTTPRNLGAMMRGDTFRRTFTLSSGFVGGNFTEIWFTMRDEIPASSVVTDTSAVAQGTKTGGQITFDPGNATLGTILLTATTTNSIDPGRYNWDAQGELSNGEIHTLDYGFITVVGDVTRST